MYINATEPTKGRKILVINHKVYLVSILPCETGYPGYPGYPGEFLGNLGDFLSFSLRVAALTKIYNIFNCVQRNSEV